ncbi:MAG: class I SAM-dependent methyltransferase [bacterium]|nr:class I SAM-dependent methyltransferase [bacterium]
MNLSNICRVCASSNTQTVFKNYPGYVEGSVFNIFKCNDCDCHFVLIEESTKRIYDIIYSSINSAGYDRYYLYAALVKVVDDPLKFLACLESTYYPVYNYLKNKSKLNILEVGCSYGYLSYAIKKRQFHIKAIDIASTPIKFARENFGDFFYNADIKEYAKRYNEKFDLIIATEVIEHLENPFEFLKDCKKILNQDGKILLTTPNKDYSKSDSIWQTDLPPVHLIWFSKRGIHALAEKLGFKVSFEDFSKHYPKFDNKLYKYFSNLKEELQKPALTKSGFPIIKLESRLKKLSLFVFNRLPFIRFPSNLIYNTMNGDENTLGILLE